MKAKEYYAKYKDRFMTMENGRYVPFRNESTDKAIPEIFNAFYYDALEIGKMRHAGTKRAWLSIIREVDKKYRVFCSMFERDIGGSPLNPEAFMLVMQKTNPELFSDDTPDGIRVGVRDE